MLQFIVSLFNTWYTAIIAIAAFFSTIWGLTKAIGALNTWIKNKAIKYREKKQLQIKIMNKLEQIDLKIDQIDKRLTQNDDCTSTVMLQKMMWAYHEYVLSKHPIPLDVQTALCVMYDQYTKNGRHNHVPADFKIKIMACEVK